MSSKDKNQEIKIDYDQCLNNYSQVNIFKTNSFYTNYLLKAKSYVFKHIMVVRIFLRR